MTKCPKCKKSELRSWEGPLDLEGVEVFAHGMRCGSCGETILDADEVGKLEKMRAHALVQRGIRSGAEFKFVRKMAGLKATELAEIFDVRPETVSRWERGEQELPRLAAFALAELAQRPRVVRERLEAMANPATR